MSLALMPASPPEKIVLKSPFLICDEEMVGISFCKGTPSTTHSGSAFPVMVLAPRIRTCALSPGRPETDFMLTPATLPCNNLSTLNKG